VQPAIRTVDNQQGRRAAILAAAEAAFAEGGYDRTRLEDVAASVGIRRASLLYHFRDKATLYAAVLESLVGDLVGRFRRSLEGDGSAGARIERTVDEWLDSAAERPALVRIMMRELADGVSEHSRPFAERMSAVFSAVGAVIEEGQATRELRQTNALHVLMVVAGAGAFLNLGGLIVDASADRPQPLVADRAEQRELIIAIFRKLLGTHAPRVVPDP
jgi:AcrR family transcriptional regulator